MGVFVEERTTAAGAVWALIGIVDVSNASALATTTSQARKGEKESVISVGNSNSR